jgi:dipeptidyl aminopeptidase/acylaminoacyl peptidase
LAEDKSKFYFTSSEGSFFERHFYSMPLSGGARTRLTNLAGDNEVIVSPDESTFAIVRSYSNKPPELYIAPNRPGSNLNEAKQITNSPTAEWLSHNWIEPPIVPIKARDGATVYGVYTNQKISKKADRRLYLFTERVICKTSIIGGALITVNICSIIY